MDKHSCCNVRVTLHKVEYLSSCIRINISVWMFSYKSLRSRHIASRIGHPNIAISRGVHTIIRSERRRLRWQVILTMRRSVGKRYTSLTIPRPNMSWSVVERPGLVPLRWSLLDLRPSSRLAWIVVGRHSVSSDPRKFVYLMDKFLDLSKASSDGLFRAS